MGQTELILLGGVARGVGTECAAYMRHGSNGVVGGLLWLLKSGVVTSSRGLHVEGEVETLRTRSYESMCIIDDI